MQAPKKKRAYMRMPAPAPIVTHPQEPLPLGRLYTLKEAAAVIGVKPRALRYWCRHRRVAIHQPARRIHILHHYLQEFLTRIQK